MANPIRAMVSRKKIRYKQDGFDLDLTYILPNMIAMGYPAEKIEGIYRNPIDEVIRFLEIKHKDHYRIYNLCSERKYDVKKFQDRVATYPFDDHNPPKLDLILPFCKDVDEWLKSDPENVAAVHCKAGKGRTGLMISCYLLHSQICDTAEAAMEYYGRARTADRKGVTIPSQRRYVKYYELLMKRSQRYQPVAVELQELYLPILPSIVTGVFAPHVKIYEYESMRHETVPSELKKNATGVRIVFTSPIVLTGDIKIVLKHKGLVKETLFHFWFNTAFLEETSVPLPSDPTIATLDGNATRVPAIGTADFLPNSRRDRGASQPALTPTSIGRQFFSHRSSTMVASLPTTSSTSNLLRGPRLKLELCTRDLDKAVKDKHSKFGANFKVICMFTKPTNNNSSRNGTGHIRRTRALSGNTLNAKLPELRPLSPVSPSVSPSRRPTFGPVCFFEQKHPIGEACNCHESSESSTTLESESEGGGWDSANDSDEPSRVRYRVLSESSATTTEPA